MYVLTIIFASSLFLLALFFAIKEREVYSGTDIWMTRFLRRHSPGAQAFASRIGNAMHARFQTVKHGFDAIYEKIAYYVVWSGRAVVVTLAHRMIQAVRGEQLLSMKSTSSMYLKHLKDHKDTTTPDAPQV